MQSTSLFKLKNNGIPVHETLHIGALMALGGGFIDAYTYLTYNEVFAFAQTGNLVLLGINISIGNWAQTLHYIFPVLIFFCGILFSELLKSKLQHNEKFCFEQVSIIIEASLLILVGLLGQYLPFLVGVSFINFACSMQMHSFRRMHGVPFVSTMCTGNLRSAAELLFVAIHHRNKEALGKMLRLLFTVFVFCIGTFLGSLATKALGTPAIFFCLIAFLATFTVLHFNKETDTSL